MIWWGLSRTSLAGTISSSENTSNRTTTVKDDMEQVLILLYTSILVYLNVTINFSKDSTFARATKDLFHAASEEQLQEIPS